MSTVATEDVCKYAPPALLSLLASFIMPRGSAAEVDLLTHIARGDRKALRTLYDIHGAKVLGVAKRVLGDIAEAEDVLQEVFVEVWKRASTYDPDRGTAGAWIATMARTRAIDRLRSRGSRDRAVSSAAAEPNPAPRAALELIEQRQDRERILSALGTLPREQRAVVELAYFEGLTQREIAQRTGEPLGTIKTRVRLAMDKLAALLGGPEPAS